MYAGKQFNTSNSTINQLPAGSTLKVTGKGQVQVVSVPTPTFKAGDRVTSKYGPATVVDITSHLKGEVNALVPSGTVFYVADGTNRVRIASPGNLTKLTYGW